MVASNLNSSDDSGKPRTKPPSLEHVLRIIWMFHTVDTLLGNEETFVKVEKQTMEMSGDPKTKIVAMLALLGMGIFDENTFKLFKELQG